MIPKVVILAGGQGTRLRPLTADRPKAMLDVLGKPFLQHQVELLAKQGLKRLVLAVGYKAEQIAAYFGDGGRFGVEIEYSHDGSWPLGTGGALRQAAPLLDGWFLVLDGDSYLPMDFRRPIRSFRARKPVGLMTVYRNENRYGRSNVAVSSGWVTAYDRDGVRMVHIHYGLSMFHPQVFEMMPARLFFPMDELYKRLAAEQKLAAYQVQQRFYEIGSFEGLRDFEAYLLNSQAGPSPQNYADHVPRL